MANISDSTSRAGSTQAGKHHSGIGFTEWMALGHLAFTLLLVAIAVLLNLRSLSR